MALCRTGPPHIDHEAEAASSKIYGASWHMIMSVATTELSHVPDQKGQTTSASEGGALQEQPSAGGAPTSTSEDGSKMLFGHIAARLLRALRSRSRALVCAAAKAAGRSLAMLLPDCIQ